MLPVLIPDCIKVYPLDVDCPYLGPIKIFCLLTDLMPGPVRKFILEILGVPMPGPVKSLSLRCCLSLHQVLSKVYPLDVYCPFARCYQKFILWMFTVLLPGVIKSLSFGCQLSLCQVSSKVYPLDVECLYATYYQKFILWMLGVFMSHTIKCLSFGC